LRYEQQTDKKRPTNQESGDYTCYQPDPVWFCISQEPEVTLYFQFLMFSFFPAHGLFLLSKGGGNGFHDFFTL
jgi:hypothetical protein